MKKKHGGPNRNQGRKSKYNEPTVYKSIRFPKSVIAGVAQVTDNFSEFVIIATKDKLEGIK